MPGEKVILFVKRVIFFITLAYSNFCDLIHDFLVDFVSKGACVMVTFFILCSRKWSLQYLPSTSVSKTFRCSVTLVC